jgi:hypothetical protein
MPILPTANFFAAIAGLAWRRVVGGVTVGREGAGFVGGTTELGGATGMRVAAVEGEEAGVGGRGGVEGVADGIGVGGGVEADAGVSGAGGGEGGVERGGGGGFP